MAHIYVLRNKDDYRYIKLYKFRVCSKYPLKMQNKVIGLSHANFGFSTIPFWYVSAPLDLKIKANPDKVDWLFFHMVYLFFFRRHIVDVIQKKLWAINLHHFFKNVVAIFKTN